MSHLVWALPLSCSIFSSDAEEDQPIYTGAERSGIHSAWAAPHRPHRTWIACAGNLHLEWLRPAVMASVFKESIPQKQNLFSEQDFSLSIWPLGFSLLVYIFIWRRPELKSFSHIELSSVASLSIKTTIKCIQSLFIPFRVPINVHLMYWNWIMVYQ